MNKNYILDFYVEIKLKMNQNFKSLAIMWLVFKHNN